MNHARFFESGNSWPKFWTFQNFWAEFPIDLRIARTHYGLCESVKTITNWVRFSHESKYLSIRVNSWDSGPVWNRGIFHTGHESPESPRTDFFLIRGESWGFIKKILQSWWSTSQSRFRSDVAKNIRENRLNSAGIAREFITISKITLEHAARKVRKQLRIR